MNELLCIRLACPLPLFVYLPRTWHPLHHLLQKWLDLDILDVLHFGTDFLLFLLLLCPLVVTFDMYCRFLLLNLTKTCFGGADSSTVFQLLNDIVFWFVCGSEIAQNNFTLHPCASRGPCIDERVLYLLDLLALLKFVCPVLIHYTRLVFFAQLGHNCFHCLIIQLISSLFY